MAAGSEISGAPELVWDVRAELGEGPLWDKRSQSLWFTDIKCRKIYRYDPADGSRNEWDCPEQVGFIVPARSGGFVLGLQSGLHRFDPETGAINLLAEVEPDRPSNRLNDAVVDAAGRLWFGTMDDGERSKCGAFYCFHAGELQPTGIENVAITNGPAVSPDGKLLYWVDTLGGALSVAEICDDGSLGSSRTLIRIHPSEGHPDGPTVDAEGRLWIAMYGGWEVRLYSPSGELLDRVPFLVANLTKVAIGGADLRTAYVTSARQKLDQGKLDEQPCAGGLFRFRVDVPGIASPAVAC